MAELKSRFRIQNRSAWRNNRTFTLLQNAQSLMRRLLSVTCVVMCVMLCANLQGAGQNAAGTASTAQPATASAPSQQAIELVSQGNGLLNKNDFSGAEADYQKALQNYPDYAAAHRGLGIALWREGVLARAWEELNTVARLEPESPQAHFELGQLAWSIYSGPADRVAATTGLAVSDFRSIALSEVHKAVSLEPHDFKMRLQLVEIELDAEQYKEAQADALGADSLASSAEERAQAHVALARAYAATGDEMRAEAEFKRAIQENPSSGAAFLGLGQISLQQQDAARALSYFDQAVHVSPGLSPAYAALARLYLQSGQRGQALTMLQKAVALDPDDWHSQFELGKMLMEAGEAARAKDLLTKIVAAHPDYLPAGEQLALMHLRQGDVQAAVLQAQALATRNPQAPEGHRVLALAFWRERQTDASLAECAQALAADPHSVSMLALQSLELWQTKRRGEARRVLHQVAQGDPSILSPVTFCRQIVCGNADVSLVRDFLHDNRYILATPADQQP